MPCSGRRPTTHCPCQDGLAKHSTITTMGYGEYSHAAHVALTQGRPEESTPFRRNGLDPLMSPHGAVREACDSVDHPNSLGVVFVLDVTGSMGDIPQNLASHTLPTFMDALTRARVPDPQVCFMAVGHAGHDAAPLQVGQFESTASLIDRWLTNIWIEGGGVGGHECYELAMFFAARHMRLDSVPRRGRRGYLFLTADVAPNPAVSHIEVQRIVGDTMKSDLPIRDLIDEVQRTFEPFVLLADTASHRVNRTWRDLLGDRVLRMGHPEDAAHIAAGLVSLLEGSVDSLHGLVKHLRATGMRQRQVARIAEALVPFAACIGRDGAPRVDARRSRLPVGNRPSGLQR